MLCSHLVTCQLDGDASCGQSDACFPTAKAMSITSGLARNLSAKLTFGQSLSKKLMLGVATLDVRAAILGL